MAVLFICLIAVPGCQDAATVAGKYVAEADKDLEQTIDLQLDSNGQGFWATEEDRIAFKWESKAEEVWLHTKTGGVIQGRVSQGAIEFTFPGTGRVIFKRM